MKTHPSEIGLEFRATVGGISPVIWRHLGLCGAASLHDFHGVLYTMCAWTGSQPYQFNAHGQTFSSTDAPGIDARAVTVNDLKLRVGEVIRYSYRNHNPWELELRLLARRPMAEGETLPVLLGGERATPDEHLADAETYLTKRHHHEYNPPVASLKLAAEAVNFAIENNTRPDAEFMNRLAIAQAEIEEYLRYTSPELNHERINRKLRALGSGGVM